MTQEELGQQPEKRKENTQCITGRSYCAETSIGCTSVGNVEKVEKAGWKAECVQNIQNRQSYETKEEKQKFIPESFQLDDTNAILNADAKLNEAVIKLFLDNFEVLATHPSQYGETEVLEMKIDPVPGVIPYKS